MRGHRRCRRIPLSWLPRVHSREFNQIHELKEFKFGDQWSPHSIGQS